jgi:hypothetical protein
MPICYESSNLVCIHVRNFKKESGSVTHSCNPEPSISHTVYIYVYTSSHSSAMDGWPLPELCWHGDEESGSLAVHHLVQVVPLPRHHLHNALFIARQPEGR